MKHIAPLLFLLLTLTLSGCFSEPRLDTSTPEAVKSSIEDLRQSLSESERQEFNERLNVFVAHQVHVSDTRGVDIYKEYEGMTAQEILEALRKRIK
ncbi:MAG: DUF6694 family lipoprotein [Desulfovibrionaceae bacterium]